MRSLILAERVFRRELLRRHPRGRVASKRPKTVASAGESFAGALRMRHREVDDPPQDCVRRLRRRSAGPFASRRPQGLRRAGDRAADLRRRERRRARGYDLWAGHPARRAARRVSPPVEAPSRRAEAPHEYVPRRAEPARFPRSRLPLLWRLLDEQAREVSAARAPHQRLPQAPEPSLRDRRRRGHRRARRLRPATSRARR